MTDTAIVIMAAGKGSRMKSKTAKVLHRLAGKPLLTWVLNTASTLSSQKKIVICGHNKDQLLNHYENGDDIEWILQKEQLGTGHALQQAMPKLNNSSRVLVLSGDVPLINTESLNKLLTLTPKNSLGFITCDMQNPFGFGRVVRNQDDFIKEIVEEKDASSEIKQISEINSGIYVFPQNFLEKHLLNISNNNKQQEYYLTDLIKVAVANNIKVVGVKIADEKSIQGVNDRLQLQDLERYIQQKKAESLMKNGVTIIDAKRLDIRSNNCQIAEDVTLDVNVILDGDVEIKSGCYIGPNTIIKNSKIFNGVRVEANSIIEDSIVGSNSKIGPFARIRPGTKLENNAKIGNFVEIKKSIVGENSKVNHLSYIGDADIGKNVNVGAGTITCNYDGINKHNTTIGDGAFIGSNTQLVAPVKVGEGATIAAGTTLVKDAPAKELTLNEKSQKIIVGWQRPKNKEVKE